MKIYIAGPMTGYPEFNRHEFKRVADNYVDSGYEVFNPAVEEETMDLGGYHRS